MSTIASSAAGVVVGQGDNKKHLLLAASGSVAVIKLSAIISALSSHQNLSIRVILTKSSAKFFTGTSPEQPTLDELAALPNVDGVYGDEDEWEPAWTRGAPILHIELRRWADALVIAPLSANTLAKMANGFCSNLLTSVVRCWEPSKGKILVAPAMNQFMWTNPITEKHIKVLEEDYGVQREDANGWVEILMPQAKLLACGDHGIGAMADWKVIARKVEVILGLGP